MPDGKFRFAKALRGFRYILPAMSFVIGVSLSWAVYTEVRANEDQIFLLEFELRAGNHSQTLQNGINSQLRSLASVSEWFMAEKLSGVYDDKNIIRKEFHEIASRQIASSPCISMIAFLPQEEGGGPRYPVRLVTPHEENKYLVGLELADDPAYRETFHSALAQRKMSASPKMRLPEGRGEVNATAVVFPLLENGNDIPFGYTMALFRVDEMIKEGLKDIDMKGMALHIYDMSDPSLPADKRLVYESHEDPYPFESREEELGAIVSGPHVARRISVAERPWSVVIHPGSGYVSQRDMYAHSTPVLVSGLLIALLTTAYTFRLSSYTQEVEQAVAERTSTIAAINESLLNEIGLRIAAEEKVRSQDMELAHAMRLASLGEMAASVSHELNQPISAIINYAENGEALIQRGAMDIVADNLREIASQGKRAAAISKSLRSYARSGDDSCGPVNVNDIVEKVAKFLSHHARQKGVELTVEKDDSIPNAFGSHLRLEQALVNVMLNAIQAVGEGKGMVRVSTSRNGDGTIIARVTDNGHGMSQETLSNLFTPFFTTKRKDEGLGLGLLISKRIVDAFGGRIEVESELGVGSIFTITLPAINAGRGGEVNA